MKIRQVLKKITPPIAISFFRLFRKKYGWDGPYSSWKEVQKECKGYDQYVIINKVKSSIKKVKNKEAIYERDGVIFDEIQYSWPLATGLMLAAQKFSGNLSVCDFGGSLGSTYYQNYKFLKHVKNFTWSIIEQKLCRYW